MTAQRTFRLRAAIGVLLVVGLGLGLHVPPAQAATRTVTVGSQGPSPATLTIAKGDVVRFVNGDSVNHTIQRETGSWSFSATLGAGQSATTAPFRAAGTFGYTDVRAGVLFSDTFRGAVVVPAPPPAASPRPSATRSATPRPAPSGPPAPAPSPSATPLPVPSGTAALPGFTLGPVPSSPASAVPAPALAPSVAASGTPTPPAGVPVAYGGKDGIVQGSAHRYGLPALLALVAIGGVVSLLVRFLLAEPGARRTGS